MRRPCARSRPAPRPQRVANVRVRRARRGRPRPARGASARRSAAGAAPAAAHMLRPPDGAGDGRADTAASRMQPIAEARQSKTQKSADAIAAARVAEHRAARASGARDAQREAVGEPLLRLAVARIDGLQRRRRDRNAPASCATTVMVSRYCVPRGPLAVSRSSPSSSSCARIGRLRCLRSGLRARERAASQSNETGRSTPRDVRVGRERERHNRQPLQRLEQARSRPTRANAAKNASAAARSNHCAKSPRASKGPGEASG